MRTTVTLDSDTEAALRAWMTRRGVSFKQALNDAIRAGVTPPVAGFRTTVHSTGEPAVDLDKALQIAGELDDEVTDQAVRAGR